jgi:glycine/D-amino acid oxidase-like deaminating enzyme
LAVEKWDRQAFPELHLPAPIGSLWLSKLAVIEVKGLVPSLWQELTRQGVATEVDRPVRHIDWEHEWPTAVTHDTIYRARRLFLTVPKLLGQELPALEQKQLLLEGKPLLPEARLFERPATWVHYAKSPLYLDPRQDRWGLVRLAPYAEERAERSFLQEAATRWLGCPLQEVAYYDLTVPGQEDGLPVFDHHPWREDCIWTGGIGQTHWPWLPAYLSRLLELPLGGDLRLRTPVTT